MATLKDPKSFPVVHGQMFVCDAIRACRERRGSSTRDVAMKVKATPREVESWEAGETLPNLQQFSRLTAIFPWLRNLVGDAGVQLIHAAHRGDDASHVEVVRTRTLPKYTRMLGAEMQRAQMTVQAKSGRKGHGLAGLSGLSEKRCEEIVLGAPVSEVEHRRVIKALPRMKAHGRLLLEFVQPAAEKPAQPVPPKKLVIDVEPRSESVPPPREAHGPDAPPAVSVVLGAKDAVPVREALGETWGRAIEEIAGPPTPVLAIPVGEAVSDSRVEEVAPGVKGHVVDVAVPAPAPKPALTIKPRTFGEHLRALREREGMSQKDLGAVFDVDNTTISNWETDANRPIRLHLDKLVQIFPELRSAPAYTPREMEKKPQGRGSSPRIDQPVAGDVVGPAGPIVIAHLPVSRTPDPMALVNFGLALGEFRAAVKNKAADAVVRLLRAGDAAGLSVQSIADAVENRGR